MRKFFSFLIYKFDGAEQWVGKDLFQETYEFICQQLLMGGNQVVACSTVFIDDTMFPGSLDQYKIFNSEISAIAKKYQCMFVDLCSPLEKGVKESGWEAYYNYDHFHPKEGGYKLISDILAQQIQHVSISRS